MVNLKLSNGSKIQQREPDMIIQTDASTKEWGTYCRGALAGENGQRRRSIFRLML